MSIYNKIKMFYLKKSNPIKYAKKIGVTVGEKCKLNGSPNWGSEPWLITIGNHVELSFDVALITHDGANWVFRNQEEYKNTVKFGRIRIDDNCFIGARSIILPGVTIGANSIVAAGAVVNKSIPSGEVWGGVPARFLMTTKEYADKCKSDTPEYSVENYRTNFKEEVNRICDMCEAKNIDLK